MGEQESERETGETRGSTITLSIKCLHGGPGTYSAGPYEVRIKQYRAGDDDDKVI